MKISTDNNNRDPPWLMKLSEITCSRLLDMTLTNS